MGLTLHTLLTPPCQVLWDCCVRCAGFPMLGEALLLIMARASDQEDSMRKQAAALCAELWFTPGSALPGRRKCGRGKGSLGCQHRRQLRPRDAQFLFGAW